LSDFEYSNVSSIIGFMESMLAMDKMVGESFRKMKQEVKSVPLAVFMRGETTFASMASGERMKQEVIDAYLKWRREHPEIFNVSSNAGGGIRKTKLGDINFATWVEPSQSKVPSFDYFSKLLNEMNMCSIGTQDTGCCTEALQKECKAGQCLLFGSAVSDSQCLTEGWNRQSGYSQGWCVPIGQGGGRYGCHLREGESAQP
jgi:hypothetical protein